MSSICVIGCLKKCCYSLINCVWLSVVSVWCVVIVVLVFSVCGMMVCLVVIVLDDMIIILCLVSICVDMNWVRFSVWCGERLFLLVVRRLLLILSIVCFYVGIGCLGNGDCMWVEVIVMYVLLGGLFVDCGCGVVFCY